MNRTEHNIQTGETKVVPLTQQEIDAAQANVPPPPPPVLPDTLGALITALEAEGIITAQRANNLRNRLTKVWG